METKSFPGERLCMRRMSLTFRFASLQAQSGKHNFVNFLCGPARSAAISPRYQKFTFAILFRKFEVAHVADAPQSAPTLGRETEQDARRTGTGHSEACVTIL